MYFEGKIIAFIIAEGRGETERKTRRDQEKKDRSASFSAGHHRARERRELAQNATHEASRFLLLKIRFMAQQIPSVPIPPGICHFVQEELRMPHVRAGRFIPKTPQVGFKIGYKCPTGHPGTTPKLIFPVNTLSSAEASAGCPNKHYATGTSPLTMHLICPPNLSLHKHCFQFLLRRL